MKVMRHLFVMSLVLALVGGTYVLLTPSIEAGPGCGPKCPKRVYPINWSECDCPPTIQQGNCTLSAFLCAESAEGAGDLCAYCYSG